VAIWIKGTRHKRSFMDPGAHWGSENWWLIYFTHVLYQVLGPVLSPRPGVSAEMVKFEHMFRKWLCNFNHFYHCSQSRPSILVHVNMWFTVLSSLANSCEGEPFIANKSQRVGTLDNFITSHKTRSFGKNVWYRLLFESFELYTGVNRTYKCIFLQLHDLFLSIIYLC